MYKQDCLGCRLANKEEKVFTVYEDSFLSCILDHDPFNPGHVLILPKEHFEEGVDFDMKMNIAVMKAVQLISKTIEEIYHPDGITICQNGGIFSELKHYHMHVVPRYKGQNFAEFYQDSPDIAEPHEPLPSTMVKMKSMIESLVEREKENVT
ncbi:HIT family hydrolase [Bacillus sp. MKU004]|nr:HIT family hydrolase [Bacillus sp. MKU004]